MKEILISGIQPTGKLHLGNYLGALKKFVELQNLDKYKCYFFIADLHSLTENFEPKIKKDQILELFADYLALGLDPKKSVIFLQSLVPAHTEAAWLLSTITPLGELKRMTQFKDKSKIQKGNINTALFIYPILMAADIILYDAALVPVGEDQLQHLEFTRTLVRKFNKKFGELFREPQPVLSQAPRIMSLDNPSKKMSKSLPKGCIFIDDPPSKIKEKIKKSVTDSGKEIKYNPLKKAGISNLLNIYSSLTSLSIREIEQKYKGKTYAEFKKDLTALIIKHFASFRRRKESIVKNRNKLILTLKRGSQKANNTARNKIKEVKRRMGISI